jgi:UDP-glucose 4-epimerase
MKILVTGGAGFIGSNFCDFLIGKKHSVVVIDDLSTGHLSNLECIIDSIEFFHEKLENFDFDAISNIDAIVHLAAQASVPISIDRFKESSSANILGTISVMEFCQQQEIPLVYASSSAIYGDLALGDDRDYRVDLLSPYAVDKYSMELYAKTSFKIHQLSSVGLRFFNVYGPRQDPTSPYSGVISIFSDRLLKGERIIINGGHQTRDFVYVGDVVKAIYESVKVCLESVVCEQVNVLTGRSISVDHLALLLGEEIKVVVDKIYKKLPDGDPEHSHGTTNKMVEILNMNLDDMVQIDMGLPRTVSFLRG